MNLSEQFKTWELKYPSIYAGLAFSCGILGPWAWGFICLPLIFIFARRSNEMLFFWCLFPFAFGVYANQHQVYVENYWTKLSTQDGLLKAEVKWDQDLKMSSDQTLRGWAWLSPLKDDKAITGLKKRIWVEFTQPSEDMNPNLTLKGVAVHAWLWPKSAGEDFPKYKVSVIEDTWMVPWYIPIRSSLLKPIRDWKNNENSQGLAYSLLTGNRQHIESSTINDFNRLGVMALLALSGLHVGIVFNLFRKYSPMGPHHAITISIGLVMVVFYTFLAAWPLSMIRAALMIGLFVLSTSLGRRHLGLNGLILLALWEWILDPNVITRLDFQLSYLGVFGIMWMMALCKKVMALQSWWATLLKMYIISWGAMIWTWPLILFYFEKIPHLSWWFAPPLFTLFGVLVFYCLFLGLLVALGLPILQWLWSPLEWAIMGFGQLSHWGSWMVPWEKSSIEWFVLYYFLLVCIGFVATFCRKPQEEKPLVELAF